jgi:peptide/nickel transport system substrate-binding protein
VLPPAFPGYRPYCPYTVSPSPAGVWLGPDLARARQLIAASHTKGMHVTVWWGKDFPDRTSATQFVSLLKRLGFRAQLKLVPDLNYFGAIADSRNRAQIGVTGWFADYPAASDFINILFSCHSFRPASAGNYNTSEFCDPAIDKQIRRALTLDASDPGAANLLWTHIDHQIVDQAPLVALRNPSWAFFVSKRVGNVQFLRVASSPSLEQIWVQ